MKKIIARAPSRIDFAGGTLDLPFFAKSEKGATLNCAVKKYGIATITPNKTSLTIDSINYNRQIKIKSKNIRYTKDMDLLKAAIKRAKFFKKATISISHDMPPHSRLGTSSSVGVAVLGAIAKYQNKPINKIKIAELATALEIEELKLANGPQDQYAAALGGINLLQYGGKKVVVKKPKIKNTTFAELEGNLVLCYVGSDKISGDVNYETLKKYEAGDDTVVRAIKNIKQITYDMTKALVKEDLTSFSELLYEELKNRDKLHKSIVTPRLQKYIKIGLKNGASAAKILGAGGGGTILFYSKEFQMKKLRDSLEKNKARTYDFRFDMNGLQTWESTTK